MSLIITSNTNKILNSGYNQEGLNKSYSYQNHLNDTFKIPKNSEIAVQSVKINRSGNVTLDRDNSIYAFYFGEELGTDTAPNVNREVCSIPVEAGFSLQVTDDDMLGSVAWRGVGKYSGNVDNVARIMKQSLNRNLWHPMLMLNASTGRNPGANVTPLRNGSGLDWLGWQIQVTSTDSSKNASNISASWMGAEYNGTEDGADYTYNPTTRILTAPTDSGNGCVGIDYPISLCNGSFHLKNIQEAPAKYGLCRALKDEAPTWFEEGADMGENFYDFEVEVDSDNDIDLYYVGSEGNDELERIRVLYPGGTKNVKDDNITDIIFNVQNERVKVSLINASGAVTVLTDGTNVDSSKNLKPVSMTCRYLYPKIAMGAGGTVKIEEFEGVNIANHEYYGFSVDTNGDNIPCYTDWWAHAWIVLGQFFTGPASQQQAQAKLIDVDFVKNITPLDLKGLNGNGQCDYKVQFFLANDERYLNTSNCNSQFLMGFPNRSLVNVPNSTGGSSPFTKTYQSDEAPEIKGTNTLFVRLKNMTFNSVNISKGSNSKILYHLPAFSTTGSRVGSLFFEPTERVYLKLNNTEDLFLSTVEIDIVYADETLAIDLVGKTTIALHIRDA
tara:strand:+ start:4037 stop:5872 length:1836 start_codon:yes stop_codon:yes gene_type:complete